MRNWIEIDGKRSQEFGLRMARLPLWPTAAETVETTPLSGIAESVGRKTGQYPDFELELTGYLTRQYDPIELAKLQSWLMRGKELVMSTQPELKGIIRSVRPLEPARIGTRANEIKIPLTMCPFKLARENFPQKFTTQTFTVLNRGNVYSEPVYKLTFQEWTQIAHITVNDVTLQITPFSISVTGDVVIYIDLPRKMIYTPLSDGTLSVCQRHTVGRFWAMVLESGWNTVEVSSGCKEVEITKNERWL